MNAVIYARYSSDRQREESIEGQLRECKEYAKAHGITIVHEYIDRALSASKNTEKRLNFLKMIQDSSKRQFEIVLVWKLDRFARDRYDSAHYKHILKKNGVRLVSATEPISDKPEGIILESMLEGMAEYYSAELSEKVRRGQKENALKGMSNGGWIPFGYKVGQDKKLEIDALTAPYVQEIFQRYADGDSIQQIMDDLNDRGIKPAHGDRFNYSTMAVILKNRKYIGEYKYRDVIIPNGIPAIVDENVFKRVQSRREKNKRTPAAAKAKEQYLLTTKLFCGKCGQLMVGESGKARNGRVHRYYKCLGAKRKKGCDLKAVKKDWIETLVIEQTMRVILDDGILHKIAERLVVLQSEENYDIKFLEKSLEDVDKSINNMLNALQAGIITVSTKQRLEELETQKVDIEQQIVRQQLEHPVLTKEQILYFLYRFRETDVHDEQECQCLIDAFVNAVYLYEDKVVFVFNYKENSKTVMLSDIEGSDIDSLSPPEDRTFAFGLFLFSLGFFALIKR